MTAAETARVLVVDDEQGIRELLVDALSDSGWEVAAAASGKEAIDLARTDRPDVLIADLQLTDCDGLEVIDRMRGIVRDLSTVVITGHRDPERLSRASRHRPVELMTKPLDIDRLRETVRREVARRGQLQRLQRRNIRLRQLARQVNTARKQAERRLATSCRELAGAHRALAIQMRRQETVLNYEGELLRARTDDDVFRALFRLYVSRSGPVFGVAMVCDSTAQLKTTGRFGVPQPDGLEFCKRLSQPLIDAVLADPHPTLLDAEEESFLFDESIRKYLPGVTALGVPLIPQAGEMIGLVVLYRKGEQPFTDGDVALAELIAHPTALAIQRND